MVISEIRRQAMLQLSKAGVTDCPSLEVLALMKFVWNTDEIGLVLMGNQTTEPKKMKQFNELLIRRAQGEPIAYLCGTKEFMSMEFLVCPGVLIPRGDTECVVEQAISLCGKKENLNVLDVGTGSGCIAISLARYLKNPQVSGVDISDQALTIAKENAKKNNVSISFSQLDILTEEPTGLFDLIISNPPYIRTDVISKLQQDVQHYEPHLALDGGEDGLVFYRRLILLAAKHLSKDGCLVFEIGFDQAKDVCDLIRAEGSFSTPQVIFDLAGRDRGIYTTKE